MAALGLGLQVLILEEAADGFCCPDVCRQICRIESAILSVGVASSGGHLGGL